MKRAPNLLSVSRIALCLPLLLVDAMTLPFWILYLIAGTTDMLDGFLARRCGVESQFGTRLDSLADFVFVIAVGYKMFPCRMPIFLLPIKRNHPKYLENQKIMPIFAAHF